MTMTFEQAQDEILTVFQDAWAPTGFPVLYPNVPGEIPDSNTPWARVQMIHTPGVQAGVSNQGGRTRWTNFGSIVIQVFIPFGEGLQRGYTLSTQVASAYRGVSTPGGAWFRNVGVTEIGPDASWYQMNVRADFQYDEISQAGD